MDKDKETEYLDIKQAAKALHVNTKKLREWNKSGALRPIRLVPLSHEPIRYTREEINRFIDEHSTNKQEKRENEPL